MAESNASSAELDESDEASSRGSGLALKQYLKELAQRDLDAINALQKGEYFEDDFFDLFSQNPDAEVYQVDERVYEQVVWQRPFQIEARCQFGLEHIRPDEIIQGNLNDCAFCATVSSIAKYPEVLRKVLPSGSEETHLYGPLYKGFFKFRFYIYGEFCDVYIDDRLPTKNKQLLYCSCRTTSVFWAPLLEKAFAKLKGSYMNIICINPVTILTELTGGIFLTFNTEDFNSFPNRYRIENELRTSSVLISCSSIKKEFTKNGQMGHAYSLLSINNVNIDNEKTRVYSLRNPHGKATEEDRYLPSFSFWNNVDTQTKALMFYDRNQDTISWFSSVTFNYYFDEVAFLYHLPSASSSSQGFLFDFHDTWEKAYARHETKQLIFNQHYLLSVADCPDQPRVDVVFNLIQELTDEADKSSLAFYVFPVRPLPSQDAVVSDQGLKRLGSIKYELEDGKSYHLTKQISALFNLRPGHYVILPVVREASMKTETLDYQIRIFSHKQINVERLNLDADSFKLFTEDAYVNLVTTKCNACNRLIGSGIFKLYNELSYHNECYDKLIDCTYDCCKEPMKTFCLTDVGLKYCKKCHESYWQDEFLNI